MKFANVCASGSTPERFVLVRAAQVSEAGAGCIDEHQVAHVEQAVLVVDDAIRRRGAVRIVRRPHALRTERAHVQPHGRRARPAVEQERDRPRAVRLVALEVRDVRHADLGRLRRRLLSFRGLRRIVVLRIVQIHDHDARLGLVRRLLAADARRTLRHAHFVRQVQRRQALLSRVFVLIIVFMLRIGRCMRSESAHREQRGKHRPSKPDSWSIHRKSSDATRERGIIPQEEADSWGTECEGPDSGLEDTSAETPQSRASQATSGLVVKRTPRFDVESFVEECRGANQQAAADKQAAIREVMSRSMSDPRAVLAAAASRRKAASRRCIARPT